MTDDDLDAAIDAITVRAFDRFKVLEEMVGINANLTDNERDLFAVGVHLGVTAFVEMYIQPS